MRRLPGDAVTGPGQVTGCVPLIQFIGLVAQFALKFVQTVVNQLLKNGLVVRSLLVGVHVPIQHARMQ